MQTVPLRPGGGAKRAKRICTPSRVFSMPANGIVGHRIGGDGNEGHRDKIAFRPEIEEPEWRAERIRNNGITAAGWIGF